MKDTAIIFGWRDKKQEYKVEINREDFYAIFYGLARGYHKIGDNQISKKLLEIIPEVDKIFINMDYNRTQDVPFIEYAINKEVGILKIMRCHRIVWSILEDHCKK